MKFGHQFCHSSSRLTTGTSAVAQKVRYHFIYYHCATIQPLVSIDTSNNLPSLTSSTASRRSYCYSSIGTSWNFQPLLYHHRHHHEQQQQQQQQHVYKITSAAYSRNHNTPLHFSSHNYFSTILPESASAVDQQNNEEIDYDDPETDDMTMLNGATSESQTLASFSTTTTTTTSNTYSGLSNLHPSIKEALRSMNIENMTEIQYKTWDASVTGTNDVLGRSRTGSGKTLAFLVPALERILRNYSNSMDESKNQVKMLIISPTRELAHQIYTTTLLLTSKLGKGHNSKPMYCQVMYGGTQKPLDIQKMRKNVPTIITSTPGRLLDHMKSSTIHGNTPFIKYIQDIDVLVLDEMDLLLDMGFREDIQSIFRYLDASRRSATAPPRQTLLFSATLPAGVKDVLRKFVRPNYTVVDCIQDDDPTSHTVSTIDQSHVILPPNKMIAGIIQTILELMKSNKQHKIIVFFPTTSQVTYFSQVFNVGLGRKVIEIHSGIAQGARTNRSDNFRHSKTGCVLFTSDVSARGVDYPNVTHVVQVGAASNRETYIHRLGRTGRAGKSGQGIIILLPNEVDFIRRDLGDINIPMNVKIQNLLKMDISECDDLENEMKRIHDMTQRSDGMKRAAQEVYSSIFGYYAQRLKHMKVPNFEEAIVSLVNGFAKQAGLQELPFLSAKVASQYRLAQHPALNVQRKWDAGSRNFDVGRVGGGGSGFGGSGNNRFGYGRGFGSGGNNRFVVGGGGDRRSDGGFRTGNTYATRNSNRTGYEQQFDSTPPVPPASTDWHGYL